MELGGDVFLFVTTVVVLIATLLFIWREWRKVSCSAREKKASCSIPQDHGSDDATILPHDGLILYGSQTGKAAGFARLLQQEAARHGLVFEVCEADDCVCGDRDAPFGSDGLLSLARTSGAIPVIFIVCTFSDGGPPDNAKRLYRGLSEVSQSALHENHAIWSRLDGLRFAVFGLGDSTYPDFNVVGRRMDERLAELGACRLLPVGLGDDAKCIDEDFRQWRMLLWPLLAQRFNWSLSTGEPESGFTVVLAAEGVEEVPLQLAKGVVAMSVRSCTQLGSSIKGRRMLRVSLEKPREMKYSAGDHLAIHPLNPPWAVLQLASLLNVQLDAVFVFVRKAGRSHAKAPFPTPCSFRRVLSRHLDVLSPPAPWQLARLSQLATASDERTRLLQLAQEAGMTEGAERCGFVDVLNEYRSIAIAPEELFEMIPLLRPRHYSIASSPKAQRDCVDVLLALVEYETTRGERSGVASGHLMSVPMGGVVLGMVRPSRFRLPRDLSVPIVMVGLGSGTAPFLGFLQERAHLSGCRSFGAWHLFCGVRNEADAGFLADLRGHAVTGVLSSLHVAQSRPSSEEGGSYVQDVLRQQCVLIRSVLMAEGGCVYVCGGMRGLSQSLRRLFGELLTRHDDDGQMGDACVELMRAEGRYIEDIWTE